MGLEKVLRWPKAHYTLLRRLMWMASLAPLAYLLYSYSFDAMGINPFQTLVHTTGICAIIFLVITLSISTLRRLFCQLMISMNVKYGRRLADWNWMIRLRRSIGNFTTLYAIAHFLLVFWLDYGFEVSELLIEVKEKNYLLVGLVSLAMLIPLSITSLKWFMKKMGKSWRVLHRLVYLIAIFSVFHYLISAKTGDSLPLLFSFIVTFLLLERLALASDWISYSKDDGMESVERD